jgi:hypothetical protein
MKWAMALIALPMLTLSTVSHAGILKNGKLFYARASFGYGTQSLDDVNAVIKGDEQTFLAAGIPASFEEFGGAVDLGAEIGFKLTKSFSMGIGINYQSNDVYNSYSDFSGIYEDDIKLSVLDVSGNVAFWVPNTGLFFGGAAGYGFGEMEEFVNFQIYGDPASSYRIYGEGDGSGFTASAFAGYQAVFTSGFLVFGKAGYAYRNLKEFDGRFTSAEFGTWSGTILNGAGRPIEFDFSGVYVLVGIGFSLGKPLS